MILVDKLFRYLVLLHWLFQIATTTLHVYHVCIQNEIISDLKPDPGLKLPGYVQILLMGGEADDVQTLVTSAHQLCDTFYKTIVLEGSEMHHLSADLSKAKQVGDVNGVAVKKLAKKVRPHFRKLHENIIFLEREIIAVLFQYSRTYDGIHGTGIGHKNKNSFDIFDKYLRKRRNFAFQLDRKAKSLRVDAKREDDNASFGVTLMFFSGVYCIVLCVFCGKHLRFIYIIYMSCFGLIVAVVCITYATIQLDRARKLRENADRITDDHYDILKEVRRDQDQLFRSRNATLIHFRKTADEKLMRQTHGVLITFSELTKRLHWIDTDLHKVSSLVDTVEIKTGRLNKKAHTILNDIKLALRNVTRNIEKISSILQ